MLCKEVLPLLETFEQNKGMHIDLGPNELAIIDQLEQKNYLARVQTNMFDSKELVQAKSELLEVQERIETIKKEFKPPEEAVFYNAATTTPASSTSRQNHLPELDILIKKEKELRSKILSFSEISIQAQDNVEINTNKYMITYAGKELVNNLRIRIQRVGKFTLEEFEHEMVQLNTTFDTSAKKSFNILQKISTHFSQIDEIHLRSTVIGLSFRNESAEEIASKFIVIMDMVNETASTYASSPVLREFFLNYENTILLAECIVHDLGNDFTIEHISAEIHRIAGLVGLVNNYIPQKELMINYVLLLYPLNFSEQKNEQLIKDARNFTLELANRLSYDTKEILPALLLELMGNELTGDILKKFQDSYQKIYNTTLTTRVLGITTALFLIC